MGDRIAILNNGVLQQVATPLEAYHRPVNRFVAGFLGEPSMNFFGMEIQGIHLVGDSFAYPLSQELRESIRNTTHVTLGVRPEDVAIFPEVDEDCDFETTVNVVEPKGNENIVYLDFHESEGNQETLVAAVDGMQTIEAGQDVVARIPERAIHLFDTNTDEALHNRPLEDVTETKVRS